MGLIFGLPSSILDQQAQTPELVTPLHLTHVQPLTMKFVNWDKKQPDDWHGEEDCVAIQYNGKWNDVSCSLKLRFVCKKHNATIPPTQPPPLPNTGTCDDGWVLYGNKCYLFKLDGKDRRNQRDAKEFCRQYGDGADLGMFRYLKLWFSWR